MASDLKPCPFCGGEANHDEDGDVACTSCGAMGPEMNSVTWADHREAWNRRTPTSDGGEREALVHLAWIAVAPYIDQRERGSAHKALRAALTGGTDVR